MGFWYYYYQGVRGRGGGELRLMFLFLLDVERVVIIAMSDVMGLILYSIFG